jgi:hypothetical protein
VALHIYMVLSNPASPEDEDPYNAWYDNTNLHDALDIPGFVSAQRYRVPDEFAEAATWRYLAIYTIETEDIAGTLAELMDRVGTDAMVISPSIDRDNAYSAPFAPWGPLVTAD